MAINLIISSRWFNQNTAELIMQYGLPKLPNRIKVYLQAEIPSLGKALADVDPNFQKPLVENQCLRHFREYKKAFVKSYQYQSI